MFTVTVREVGKPCTTLPYIADSLEAAHEWVKEDYFQSVKKGCGESVWMTIEQMDDGHLRVQKHTRETVETGWILVSNTVEITTETLQDIFVSSVPKRTETALIEALGVVVPVKASSPIPIPAPVAKVTMFDVIGELKETLERKGLERKGLELLGPQLD